MENVIYKLKEPQKGVPKSKQVPTLVYMYFSFGYYEVRSNGSKNYLPLKYSTGMKITPFFWNDKPAYRAKEKKEFEYKSFNTKLDNLHNLTIKVFRKLEEKGVLVTPGLMRDELNKARGKGPDLTTMKFTDIVELIIRDSKEGLRQTPKGKKISPITIKGYNTTLYHLKRFEEISGRRLENGLIDIKFYNEFSKYMADNEYSLNTKGKNLKNIKVFLKEAFKRGLTTNEFFKDSDFKVPEEDSDQIYLNSDELLKIYSLNLASNDRLNKVRDLFIVGCCTGLRFSDIGQIRSDNFIHNTTRIKVWTQKTGEPVEIPLHWMVKNIHEKYSGSLPRMISNQKFNEYIKEIGKMAGIIVPVVQDLTKGTLKTEKSILKYKLIVSHTARRSFATNAYLSGLPSISIMKITGHKTEKSFLKYIKISQEDNARLIEKHEFFNPSKQLKINK